MTTLRARLEGSFWEHSQRWRRPLRRLRDAGRRLGRKLRGEPAAVVAAPRPRSERPAVAHPAIAVVPIDGAGEPGSRDALRRALERQTERSVSLIDGDGDGDGDGDPAPATAFVLHARAGDLDRLPACHLEALLLAAAAEDLAATVGGWAALPAEPEAIELDPGATAGAGGWLLRTPRGAELDGAPVIGRLVPHITADQTAQPEPTPGVAGAERRGAYLLRHDGGAHRAPRTGVLALDTVLAALPAVPGPPSVLFLLPYLAVGGAERQLLDLLDHFGQRVRTLVVTLEPHTASRGHSLDACRQRTPHLYTLGDYLPPAAHLGALCHLLRRYSVRTLVSWNGTVAFYDHAEALRRAFPGLRILNQHYNHQGGWMGHLGRRTIAAVDVQLAVNRRIATALAGRGVPAAKIATVHPAARVVPLPDAATRRARRRQRRRALGLPADALVVGSFIRLHAQKRPLDIVALARRLPAVSFLLVGGGPLDAAVDGALAARPAPNLHRLGLRHDVEALYEALDLCLLTSSFEGLPVFLLDGLVRAIPCVATAVGEVPLLLADGGGVLVERVGDLDALAAGITALSDPARRAEEGARGRRTVAARFDLDSFCRRYEALFLPAEAR